MLCNIRENKVILKQEREAAELQQTQKKPANSVGNFVEQLAGQKQELSLVHPSTENSKKDSHDEDLGLIKQTQHRFELVDARIQNIESKIIHRCKLSYTLLARRNLGVRKFMSNEATTSSNSMAVNMAKDNQHTGTRRARFKQRFHQFQKRRDRDRYRLMIASFRSKHRSWVVAKKKEKISSHTFSFPPLGQLAVSDDECYRGDSLVMIPQKASELSLLEGAGTLLTTVNERSDGIFYARKIQGTDKKQITGSSMTDIVFMNGVRLIESSVLSRILDPGEIFGLVNFNGGDKMLMKWWRSHESEFQESISLVKEFQVPSPDRLCHCVEVLTLEIKAGIDKTLCHNSVLANHVWEPGGMSAEQVQLYLLVEFYGYDRMLMMLQRFHVMGFQRIITMSKVFSFDKVLSLEIQAGADVIYALDSDNSNQVLKTCELWCEEAWWIMFGIYCCKYKKQLMLFVTKGFKLLSSLAMDCEKLLDSLDPCLCEYKKQRLRFVYKSLDGKGMCNFSSLRELLVESKTRSCANAYLVKTNTDGSNINVRTTEMNQQLELSTHGPATESVRRLKAPLLIILVTRPRDPGRFNKQSQCGVKSKQDWWRFVQKLIIQNHDIEDEVRTRKQEYEALAFPHPIARCLSIHLENKVYFLRASNSRYQILICDKEKKKLKNMRVCKYGWEEGKVQADPTMNNLRFDSSYVFKSCFHTLHGTVHTRGMLAVEKSMEEYMVEVCFLDCDRLCSITTSSLFDISIIKGPQIMISYRHWMEKRGKKWVEKATTRGKEMETIEIMKKSCKTKGVTCDVKILIHEFLKRVAVIMWEWKQKIMVIFQEERWFILSLSSSSLHFNNKNHYKGETKETPKLIHEDLKASSPPIIHIVNSCFLENKWTLTANIEDASREVMFSESRIGKFERCSAESLTYEVFHIQRPPELCNTSLPPFLSVLFISDKLQGLSVAFAGGSHQSSRNLSLILTSKGKLHLLHVENKRARWGKEETMADGEKVVCSPEVVGVRQWCWFHEMRKR
ncbi:hypothetical protein AXX17_AT4G06550 [Arabidopsis thaliana]|uniref:Uncharacterized protein n=1 Tax=Arabidopsis thaliana TaxID=3702 RepID=A0A178V5T6_ARATH|nr:hypothetical protein AXX17_AT4G06550 [Arabidopsis thaliana]